MRRFLYTFLFIFIIAPAFGADVCKKYTDTDKPDAQFPQMLTTSSGHYLCDENCLDGTYFYRKFDNIYNMYECVQKDKKWRSPYVQEINEIMDKCTSAEGVWQLVRYNSDDDNDIDCIGEYMNPQKYSTSNGGDIISNRSDVCWAYCDTEKASLGVTFANSGKDVKQNDVATQQAWADLETLKNALMQKLSELQSSDKE